MKLKLYISSTYALIIVLLATPGCSSTNSNSGSPAVVTRSLSVGPDRVFYLTDSERKNLIKKGNSGDAAAAVRLSAYYESTADDVVSASYWLQRAAEFGDKDIQKYMKATMEEEKSPWWRILTPIPLKEVGFKRQK